MARSGRPWDGPRPPKKQKQSHTRSPPATARPHLSIFSPTIHPQVHLTFALGDETTRVTSLLSITPASAALTELLFDGRPDISLVSVRIDGQPAPHALDKEKAKLSITGLPSTPFTLEVVTDLIPRANTSLEGLYVSGGMWCTQCEAEGFRGITFFPDRPDVMAPYTTRMEADLAAAPILLSNGNLVEAGVVEGSPGRHYAVWEDPFPKPCYLFALVAGDLAKTAGVFTTASGRAVDLHFYTAAKDAHKVDYAIESLKKAMAWDEEAYGLEYDLNLFNVVAVDDFVMGAMENKSLNIFNSRLVLASPTTASDGDYARIEGVIGHEYFHNWTGNRVTCRDWFQLTLKEGLTVYRDQEFSADMGSRPVKRIEDVCRLRAAQFPEDAGAMAHPIRPESYIKMDNFYTCTVYEKGAEVVRLYETLLGKDGFRKGMDLYFARHDGAAVTCDDFRAAMADANGTDLSAFSKWYEQAGTPGLVVKTSYDEAARTFTLSASQATPATPGQNAKAAVPIPIRMGLLGPDGAEMELQLKVKRENGGRGRGGERGAPTPTLSGKEDSQPRPSSLSLSQGEPHPRGTTTVLLLDTPTADFTFTGIPARPVPSLLRGFSAPVKMDLVGQTEADLTFLMAHDADAFNRWEAGQRLFKGLIMRLYEAAVAAGPGADPAAAAAAAGGVPEGVVSAVRAVLTDSSVDGAFTASAISLPAAAELVDAIDGADPVLLHGVRTFVVASLANALRPELEAAVAANDVPPTEPYSPDFEHASKRALKNRALAYLSYTGDAAVRVDLLARARAATNMTDRIAAVAALVDAACPEREAALAEYAADYGDEPLAMLKWLAIQAGADMPDNLGAVKALAEHPAFAVTNPNCCYSLYLAFQRSPLNFHAADGSGYEFIADSVLAVDRVNKQVAARIAGAFTAWKSFDAPRQAAMQAALRRIAAQPELSENVYEIVTKSMDGAGKEAASA